MRTARMKAKRQERRCAQGDHDWLIIYPAIWGAGKGGYASCSECSRRGVLGNDAYGPVALYWKQLGSIPPDPAIASRFNDRDWSEWKNNAIKMAADTKA